MKRSIKALAVVISLFILMIPVYGMAPVETDRICNVTIEEYPGEGAKFRFYKVADADETMIFTLTDTFKPYEETVIVNNIQDQETWAEMAVTLAAYASGDELPYAYEGTIKDGRCELQMETGLYLVLSDPVEYKDYNYKSLPMIITVPKGEGNSADVEEWEYDFRIEPKYEKEKVEPKEKTYKVIKQWKDGDGKRRPASISVNILKNGKVNEKVTLNKSNNWTYTWKAEDDGSEWQVQEVNIPSGYKVSISRNQTTYTILNSYNTPPHTGDETNNNLPMILLCISGAAALISGMILLRSRKEEADQA